jgi:O-antigen/teichoic acid export membrane protein
MDDEMEKSILNNIAVNFTGLVLPVFVSLVTVPAYIRGMGLERYGVNNLVWAVIGYCSVFEFGIAQATENRIARGRHFGTGIAQRIFWSAFFLNLITGSVAGLLIWACGWLYIERFVTFGANFREEVLSALPWIGLAIPIGNVSLVFAGAINAMERFRLFNVNQTIGTFLFQLLPLAALVFFSPSLAIVVPAAVVARMMLAMLLGFAAFRAIGITRVLRLEWPVVKELVGYGRWIVLYTGATAISTSLDRMVVGSMLGAKAVAYYVTPQNLVSRLEMLPGAVCRTLFPRLSAAGKIDAEDLSRQSLAFLNFVFTPCVIVGMFALSPFMNVWLGHEMAQQCAPVGRIILLSVWIAGQSSLLCVLLQANSSPVRVAAVGWIGLPIYAVLLWIGIRLGGIMGASFAMVGKTLLDYIVFLCFSRLDARRLLRDMAGHVISVFVALYCASRMESLFGIAAVAFGLVVLSLAWSLFVSCELREIATHLRRWLLPSVS